MKTFQKISLIKNCDLKKLFDFHLDVENLRKITPPNTRVELLNKNFVPSEGAILKLKTIKSFIPTRWEVKIEKLKEPNLLVDVALKSPFKYWKHSHIFTQKGNMCELRDEVIYELPFGKIGQFFNPFIQKELENMFTFRHEVTKKLLSQETSIN